MQFPTGSTPVVFFQREKNRQQGTITQRNRPLNRIMAMPAGSAEPSVPIAEQPVDDLRLQPAGVGNVPHHRTGVSGGWDRQRFLVRRPPPDRRLAVARLLDLGRRVVAPAHGDRQLTAARSDEKLSPIDDGKNALRAALRSSFDSSASPADSGTASRWSSSSASALRSGGVPVGISKPATHQFDGRARGPATARHPAHGRAQGPTRSSRSASTRRWRTAPESTGGWVAGIGTDRIPYTEPGCTPSQLQFVRRRPLGVHRQHHPAFENVSPRSRRRRVASSRSPRAEA